MMKLVDTPDNPAPEGGTIAFIEAADGVRLRTAMFMPEAPAHGTVLLATGRAETIEKYFETIRELLARNLAVVIFDWRGQGLSARLLRAADKGHIADFAHYQRDLDAVLAKVFVPHAPKPWFALGHSMGGAILLEHAHRQASPFERMVLCAPMIDLVLTWPRLARFAAHALHAIGLGRAYVPSGRREPIVVRGFERNPLTTDRFRFDRLTKMVCSEQRLSLGDPTIGWAHAAFRQMARFADPDYPRTIHTPLLVFAPQDDWVTDSFAAERFCARVKIARLIWMPGARHEILMERDTIRARFWAGFDAFVPGSVQEVPAADQALADSGVEEA